MTVDSAAERKLLVCASDLLEWIESDEIIIWSRVFLGKLIVTQLIKTFPPSMEPECSLLVLKCSYLQNTVI